MSCAERELMERWSHDQISALIQAYREEPCLYAIKTAAYRNKHLRERSFAKVVDAVHLVRPGTTKEECIQKIYNLRSSFNNENMKRKTSMKSGAGLEDVYVPNLWYFQDFRFLEEHVLPRKKISSKVLAKNAPRQRQCSTQSNEDDEVLATDGCSEASQSSQTCSIDNADVLLSEDYLLPRTQAATRRLILSSDDDEDFQTQRTAPTLRARKRPRSRDGGEPKLVSAAPRATKRRALKEDKGLYAESLETQCKSSLDLALHEKKKPDHIEACCAFVESSLRKLPRKAQGRVIKELMILVLNNTVDSDDEI